MFTKTSAIKITETPIQGKLIPTYTIEVLTECPVFLFRSDYLSVIAGEGGISLPSRKVIVLPVAELGAGPYEEFTTEESLIQKVGGVYQDHQKKLGLGELQSLIVIRVEPCKRVSIAAVPQSNPMSYLYLAAPLEQLQG